MEKNTKKKKSALVTKNTQKNLKQHYTTNSNTITYILPKILPPKSSSLIIQYHIPLKDLFCITLELIGVQHQYLSNVLYSLVHLIVDIVELLNHTFVSILHCTILVESL